MPRSKSSDLKPSDNQQLCENWVSKSADYLEIINVSYYRIFDKNIKVVRDSTSTKPSVIYWEHGIWYFCNFLNYRSSFSLKKHKWRKLWFCGKL